MGQIAMSNHIVVRDNFGRFYRDIKNAGERSIDRALALGEQVAIDMAPEGHKVDRRPGHTPIKSSMYTEKTSRTQGYVANFSLHAMPQEHGAGAHFIIAHGEELNFFWERAGRWWIPGLRGTPDWVFHPGNASQPFLRPAYKAMTKALPGIMQAEYPG